MKKPPRQFTHAELCAIASKWLRFPESRGGHGCQTAFTEIRVGDAGERPDAIGFRCATHRGGVVLVECKTSRADFLADAKKPHRQPGAGVGRWRYFMCPEDLLKPQEMPPGWGLLYVTSRGSVRAVHGFAMGFWGNRKNLPPSPTWREEFARDSHQFIFEQRDHDAEVFAMAELISRVADAEKVNLRIRETDARYTRLVASYEVQRKQIQRQNTENWQQRVKIDELEKQIRTMQLAQNMNEKPG